MDEVKEFVAESNELTDQIEPAIERLHSGERDTELLAEIFRGLHTIKGCCGFLGLDRLERLTHSGESLLGAMRDGLIEADAEVISVVRRLPVALRKVLAIIETKGSDEEADFDALVEQLEQIRNSRLAQEMNGGKAASGNQSGEVADASPFVASPIASPSRNRWQDVDPDQDYSQKSLGEILVEHGVASPEDIVLAIRAQKKGDPRHIGELLVAQGVIGPDDVKRALELQGGRAAREVEDADSIQVDLRLLDKLMNLMGELVLARNQVQQFTARFQDVEIHRTSQRLNLITSELQEGVMKTRMVPVETVWSKFPRLVRHLAVVCDKKVKLEMDGEDVELDKTIIEAIRDPLTHFLRNSMDHGIENPEERAAAGKPETGTIHLRAFHEGGQVNMEVSDDGKGIDPAVIRRRALDKGLITAAQASELTDAESINLVFLPGFSTAAKVTSVSGRGVGMDVVKTNVERIGGSVDLLSEVGAGSTLKIKIPLTLAIIPSLLVSCGGGRFALPQTSLVELVRLEGREAAAGVEYIDRTPVYRLRGELLPLVFLDQQLGFRAHHDIASGAEELNIVVLNAHDRTFGLVVDEINDTVEIVVKPLGRQLKSLRAFAGATILGDGRVTLILDVIGLAQSAGIISEVQDRSASEVENEQQDDGRPSESLVLLRLGERGRMAIPLSAIDRLEEIATSEVERVQMAEVVQYRDSILPLLRLSDALGVPGKPAKEDRMSVLVYHEGPGGRGRVGLVVDEILDIVEQEWDPEKMVADDESDSLHLGSTIIQERVTDLLNIKKIVGDSGLMRSVSQSTQRLSA